ncbi:hypothetical protein CK203_110179 [Vitis vinifera]|uniref:Retrovirus-related Pol polyprotein from transposon RE2 n=1 Tax=Vitis vinifera TaxID=29760 RepID=A0A438FHH9_VITVI|nr:hypothetical protein CK203_110179 [Vitis vinifera]
MVSEQPFSQEHLIPNMSSSSESIPPNTHPFLGTDKQLIALSITTQINEKLTPFTFPQWRAQFEAVLIGYDLLDYDKLILSAILAFTPPTITLLIATTKTSHEAWNKLNMLYASRSRIRVMQLKEELDSCPIGVLADSCPAGAPYLRE